MKKVLCIIDYLGAGGAQRQMIGLASYLSNSGYDVTLATYFDMSFYLNDMVAEGVTCVCIKDSQKPLKRLLNIARYIHRERPDVVISYLETPSICASFARLFSHRFRLIVSERSNTQHTGFNERIRFNLFRIANYVVPNSYSQENYIRKTFPFLSDKLVTIPNFVDLDYFVPPVNRQKRPIPEIMVAATIWASKNTLGFIDAVSSLKKKGYKFHVSWYGLNELNKDYSDLCHEKIKRLGVEDCIELKEKTLKIKDRYQDAGFFCLPSLFEGTPNVICEAMACGLPVVCSDVCDNSKYVIDGENGFLFNPKDTDSIVAALERILSLDQKDYLSFCERSRAIAQREFAKERFINSYIGLIEQ